MHIDVLPAKKTVAGLELRRAVPPGGLIAFRDTLFPAIQLSESAVVGEEFDGCSHQVNPYMAIMLPKS